MGARKLKVKKQAKRTAQKAGNLLQKAADKALKSLGGRNQLGKSARKAVDAAASAIADAVAPRRKKKKK